jgi:iron only hydrogenase large subunit-like protein
MIIEAGCLNGGGQIKPISGQSAKELRQLLESVYMENVRIIEDELVLKVFFFSFFFQRFIILNQK